MGRNAGRDRQSERSGLSQIQGCRRALQQGAHGAVNHLIKGGFLRYFIDLPADAVVDDAAMEGPQHLGLSRCDRAVFRQWQAVGSTDLAADGINDTLLDTGDVPLVDVERPHARIEI